MGSRASGPGPDTQALLLELHQRLDAHFASLAAQRAAQQPPIPVFALEHGLTLEQSETLKSLVRASVRANAIPRNEWLPFVVYAAEIGYEYSGDEYWQTFEAKTPGWAFYGDRDYIRRMFRRFQQQFGGALPQGRWADQFSIICWPITHAVLPTDLQRHLARLLFYSHYFNITALAPGLVDENILVNKLGIVFIGGNHVYNMAFGCFAFCYGANYIIGFAALTF